MALPRLAGESTLTVTGGLESAGYIAMTEDALRLSGIRLKKDARKYTIPGGQTAQLPAQCRVEGDWSNAAFFLCMGALSPAGITVTGLAAASSQGDRAVLEILRRFGADVVCGGRRVGDQMLAAKDALIEGFAQILKLRRGMPGILLQKELFGRRRTHKCLLARSFAFLS